jgi:hypothetical protein
MTRILDKSNLNLYLLYYLSNHEIKINNISTNNETKIGQNGSEFTVPFRKSNEPLLLGNIKAFEEQFTQNSEKFCYDIKFKIPPRAILTQILIGADLSFNLQQHGGIPLI